MKLKAVPATPFFEERARLLPHSAITSTGNITEDAVKSETDSSPGLQLQLQRPVLRILVSDGKSRMMVLSKQAATIVVAIIGHNHTLTAAAAATALGERRLIQNLRRF